jgi:hypothetical protein
MDDKMDLSQCCKEVPITKAVDLVAQTSFETVDFLVLKNFSIIFATPATVEEVGQEAICMGTHAVTNCDLNNGYAFEEEVNYLEHLEATLELEVICDETTVHYYVPPLVTNGME